MIIRLDGDETKDGSDLSGIVGPKRVKMRFCSHYPADGSENEENDDNDEEDALIFELEFISSVRSFLADEPNRPFQRWRNRRGRLKNQGKGTMPNKGQRNIQVGMGKMAT